MGITDFLPDPSLTEDEKKLCCQIMRETGYIPQPATAGETGAIIAWLNATKGNLPNCMTYEYKDCCFQKENGKWHIAMRTNDFLYRKLLERGNQQ